MASLIDELQIIITNKHHVDLSGFSNDFVTKIIQKRTNELGMSDLTTYLKFLKEHSDESQLLMSKLYISYSQFFRDPLIFSAIEHDIIPMIIAGKSDNSEIRVWCAGCAYGQEAYSIAILLNQSEVASAKKLRFRIFGTDISETAIHRAKAGFYTIDELQNVRLAQLHRYFMKNGDGYSVIEKIKNNVVFTLHDLLNHNTIFPPESIYGGFDLVLCGNTLFYYKEEIQKIIVGNLVQSLNRNGYLITSDAEKTIVNKSSHTKLQHFSIPIFKVV